LRATTQFVGREIRRILFPVFEREARMRTAIRDENSSFRFSTSFINCRTFRFAKLAQLEDSRQTLIIVPFPRISLCAGMRWLDFPAGKYRELVWPSWAFLRKL
jgi:hypothetical protein